MSKSDDTSKQEQENISRMGAAKVESAEMDVLSAGLRVLEATGIPYMVGGAYAMHAYTGIWRNTKDLDVFLKPQDLKRALTALADAGFGTEVRYHHWLAKAHKEPYFIDLIFGAGNGRLQVDDSWFRHSTKSEVFGVETQLLPVEEFIVLKAYVAARERFDGADIVHVIHKTGGNVDWELVLSLLDDDRSLLLWHLILFDFVYPDKSHYLPQTLMQTLFSEMRSQWIAPQKPQAFRGTLLDRLAFAVDVEDWGYEDPRDLSPQVDESGDVV